MKAREALAAAAPVRVLVVEDVAADAELEVRELRRAGLRFEHLVVDSEDKFLRALAEFAPHVIISDFSMPQFDGMAALALARSSAPDTPFIFVSGTIGEEYAIRALKNGATDYVLKTNLVRLPAAVERALEEAIERRARRAAEAELEIARERLTSISNSLADVLWSVELPGERIVYMSPAAAEVYGYTPENFYADPELWIKVVHPQDREQMLEAWRGQFDGAAFDLNYRVVRPDGSVRWVHDRGRMVRDAAGAPLRIDGMARDITEAMEQRQRLASLSRIRDFTSAINSALVRLRGRQELFDEFCRIAVERGGFTVARVAMLDESGRRLRIAGGTKSEPDPLHDVVDDFNRDPDGARSLLATALRGGLPVVSGDVATDERVAQRAELTGGGSFSVAVFPLALEGEVVGAVSFRSAGRDAFDAEQVRVLRELTGNLSFALELIAKREKVDYLAYYDALTDLPNRMLFRDRLMQAIETARREGNRVGLMMFDVQRFRTINDTLGLPVGDRVLQLLARRLREVTADNRRLARLAGDVFAVMFPAVREEAFVARAVAATVAEFLDLPLNVEGREIRVSAKAGIAVFPDDGPDADTLFRNAEASLARAKATGEHYLFCAPQVNARMAEQVALEQDLRRALERGELGLHFQPKVELASRRIVGLEALMRWTGPDGKPVSPARFVPVLEETGMIFEASRQALAAAASTYRAWQAAGLKPPRIAVNVSSLQLRRASFVADLRAALSGSGDSGIDLEITESLLMQDVEASIAKLREARELGLSIALDDFGTGYSSLAYLSRLPIDTVKIDRGFVRGMTEDANNTSIVATIISLAQALRLKVVAEGVETEQQAQLLRLLRCDQMQGYLFSPPLPREQLEPLLHSAPG